MLLLACMSSTTTATTFLYESAALAPQMRASSAAKLHSCPRVCARRMPKLVSGNDHTLVQVLSKEPPRRYRRYVVEDRWTAIRWAIGSAQADDCVVIAGRGHRDCVEWIFDGEHVVQVSCWAP